MSSLYFGILVVLVVLSFFLGQRKAATLPVDRASSLHSLPSYHGLFLATLTVLPMLVVFVVGAPLAERYIESAGLSSFDPALIADNLQRGALLRDVQMLVLGQYSGTPIAGT